MRKAERTEKPKFGQVWTYGGPAPTHDLAYMVIGLEGGRLRYVAMSREEAYIEVSDSMMWCTLDGTVLDWWLIDDA